METAWVKHHCITKVNCDNVSQAIHWFLYQDTPVSFSWVARQDILVIAEIQLVCTLHVTIWKLYCTKQRSKYELHRVNDYTESMLTKLTANHVGISSVIPGYKSLSEKLRHIDA